MFVPLATDRVLPDGEFEVGPAGRAKGDDDEEEKAAASDFVVGVGILL